MDFYKQTSCYIDLGLYKEFAKNLPDDISMLAELLRRDSNYSVEREAKNKIYVTCRGQVLLLASTLKAKEIPTRVRSGFAEYPTNNGVFLTIGLQNTMIRKKENGRM